MLLDILPGLREVRGPLAAGYLWLLFAWLVAEDDVESAGGVVGRLTELGGGVTDAVLLATASFAAYLVGSLSEDVFGRALNRVVSRVTSERLKWPRLEESDMSQALIESEIARLENRADRTRAEASLRVAILPPLTALLVYFVLDSAWWLPAGLLVPALLAQAYLRRREFAVSSIALHQLRQLVGLPPGTAAEATERESA